MSWSTLAWLSQPLGDWVELAFLGGASFTRLEWEQEFDFVVPALALLRPDFIDAIAPSVEVTEFSVDPIVGIDARVRLADRLWIVPGMRLQGASIERRAGWLLRPSIGVRWGF